jgi:Spx/MgsR family transcriptional regulator
MRLQIYGLKKCGTCKKALAWLKANKVACEFIDYRENPIPPERLKAWATQVPWEKLVNRASPTWRNLDESRKDPQDDAAWLDLIAEHPTLVRRPVVVSGVAVSVGFSEKRFSEMFGR